MLDKLILYIAPGHQCTELMPWLINHSPDIQHGRVCTFDSDWTEYQSSWGHGWEPMDSQWTIQNPKLRMAYKQARMNGSFDSEFMDSYVTSNTGVRCLFFNIPDFKKYTNWITPCREWFAEHYPQTQLVFVGHTQHLETVWDPSLFFVKEGYILDELDTTFDSILKNSSKLAHIINVKVKSRFHELNQYYKQLNFDHVFDVSNIQDINRCRDLIASVVTIPENFDELHNRYFELNPGNPPARIILKNIMGL